MNAFSDPEVMDALQDGTVSFLIIFALHRYFLPYENNSFYQVVDF